jgi:hypothetical protein
MVLPYYLDNKNTANLNDVCNIMYLLYKRKRCKSHKNILGFDITVADANAVMYISKCSAYLQSQEI